MKADEMVKEIESKERMFLTPVWEKDGRILVRRAPAAKTTRGGLHIPTEAQNAPWEGLVLRVTEGVKQVKVGDYVLMRKFSGINQPSALKDVFYTALEMSEVFAKVDPELRDEILELQARSILAAEEESMEAPTLDGMRGVSKLPAFMVPQDEPPNAG